MVIFNVFSFKCFKIIIELKYLDVCEAVPFATLNNCELNLNLTDATIGWYAVALQIEDFQKVNSTVPMSSVKFFMN